MDILCMFLGLLFVSLLTYWFLTRTYKHWQNQNVPSIPNPLPGVGHMWPVLSFKKNAAVFIQNIYNSTEASMIGFYFIRKPTLLVRDPELVKSVFQTNFTSFHRNMVTVNERYDPVMAKNPFLICDLEKWKIARARAISHFTNKKLKDLFLIVQEVSCKINAYLDRKINENDGVYECELKQLFTRYTCEIIANAAFAIEGQSFEDDPHKMSFFNVSPSVFKPSFINRVKQTMLSYLPDMAKLCRVRYVSKETEAYFRENLKAIIKKRRQLNMIPNDFLQICIESNSDDDIDAIIADVIMFYVDTYGTTSLVSAYLFYNISVNKDVEAKLRNHIFNSLEPTKGVITYESLKSMSYLEQVLNESLRLAPPFGVQKKSCTKEISLLGSDGLKANLKPGDLVFISSRGLCMDPEFWSEPEVFDPDRFSPENQASRTKCLFFPFGTGPRMCPGMRFSIMLIKHLTATIITNYSLESSRETQVPFVIEPGSFMTMVKGGLWAKFKKLS